ncbi:MAG: hypothetical protein HYZ92_01240 [Candidatus Omnitrophica bacterium]|nr:hypothetical protein [Candidatus Omnitrophota bacterium]
MATQKRPSYRRRRWIVEPAYQWTMTSAIVGFLLLVVLANLVLIYYALWSTLHALELNQEAVFVAVFRSVAWTVTSGLMIMVPLVILGGLLLTHKVVGPLERLRYALDQLGTGQHNLQLKLRRGDVLAGLADSINRLAATLRQRR